MTFFFSTAKERTQSSTLPLCLMERGEQLRPSAALREDSILWSPILATKKGNRVDISCFQCNWKKKEPLDNYTVVL